MSTALTIFKQAVGLEKTAPTTLDLKLLVDSIGRTLPTYEVTGNGTVSWLGSEGNELTKNGYTNHGTAYSIIKYILDAAKPLPWGVYQLVKDEPVKLVSHPLYDLLYRPNPKQTWAELKEQWEGYMLTTGNAYLYGVRPAAGSKRDKVGEIWCLPSPLVEVEGGGWMQEVSGYSIQNANGTKTTYAAKDVLHSKFWNPDNSRYGLSPVAAGIHAITAAKSGLEERVRQYQNGGPRKVIFDEKAIDKWSAEQSSSVRNWLRSYFRGGTRSGELPITGGKLGTIDLGTSIIDLGVLDAIPFDKDAVADLFHFPGQLLNGSKGTTFANMSEAGKALYNRCVIPLETQFRDGLNRWLGQDYGDKAYINFDLSGVAELQEDLGKLATWLATAWWIPVREKQRMMGIEVEPDNTALPKYIVPSTLVGADQAFAPADPAVAVIDREPADDEAMN